MNCTVKKHNLLKILFIIIVLMDIRLFYMYDFNGWYKLILAIITFIFTIAFCPKRNGYPTKSLQILVFATFLSFTLVFVWSLLRYGNGFKTTLGGESANYKMLFILLAYPLTYICASKQGVRWLLNLLNKITTIFYILIALQFVVYNVNGTVFLNAISTGSNLQILYGSLRISLSWLGELMLLYNFYMIYCKRETIPSKSKRFWYLFNFVLGFIDCLVVSRVRGSILPMCLCLVVIVLLQRNTKQSIWRKLLLIAVICGVAFGTDIFSSFFESFSESATRGYSTTARLYAIEYYWNIFLKNPLCGFGFADGIINYGIVHGDGRAAISDVGIFGVLAKYGIFTFAIYIIPLVRSFVLIRRMYKFKNIENQLLYLAFGLYIAATSITLIAIGHYRMIQWVVYISIIEYVYWVGKNKIRIIE